MINLTNNRMKKAVAGIGISLSIAICAGSIAMPQSAHAATASSSSKVSSVVSIGKKYIGVPYKFGAKSGITSSFDCSSFTQYVYKKVGVSLPRSSKQQAKSGSYVSKSNLKAGDLIFTDTNRDGIINHVSIYIGSGKLLHTYRVGVGVTISNFKGSTWDKTYVTARRVIR
ncbi:cell wall-associated NlpC family hydrolase [Paenibacillus endophyticus]|uniref:Cell wall-associated NlpC family hydrolase n=1 Tax=Paenibacillus endophyticus TaxID=1294268 RepID=A0A7W5GA15_9BACL|nr:C40 family peptidase [Paenibacillus endophyticus]MBB3151527.1 cell wall-associated NlpC family hydrolase [Paenibacillus endophyticus]